MSLRRCLKPSRPPLEVRSLLRGKVCLTVQLTVSVRNSWAVYAPGHSTAHSSCRERSQRDRYYGFHSNCFCSCCISITIWWFIGCSG
jgi:hypothetical protein